MTTEEIKAHRTNRTSTNTTTPSHNDDPFDFHDLLNLTSTPTPPKYPAVNTTSSNNRNNNNNNNALLEFDNSDDSDIFDDGGEEAVPITDTDPWSAVSFQDSAPSKNDPWSGVMNEKVENDNDPWDDIGIPKVYHQSFVMGTDHAVVLKSESQLNENEQAADESNEQSLSSASMSIKNNENDKIHDSIIVNDTGTDSDHPFEPTVMASFKLEDVEEKETLDIHNMCSELNWDPLLTILSNPQPHLKPILLERKMWNLWTPLMIACVHAPLSILELLIKLCPEAVKVADRSGSLPLHFVSSMRRPDNEETTSDEYLQILKLLVSSYPDSLTTTNTWGQTCLHSGLETKKEVMSAVSISVLLGLVEDEDDCWEVVRNRAQEALLVKDSKSCIPLHLACRDAANQPITISLLAQTNPKSCLITNSNGDLPIHVLYQSLQQLPDDTEISDDVLKMCLDSLLIPLTKEEASCGGSGESLILPIEIACFLGASFSSLSHLLQVKPETASHQNNDKFPIEIYEDGRMGVLANDAKDRLCPSKAHLLSAGERVTLPKILEDYLKSEDLLFAYFPEVRTEKMGFWRKDPIRMARLEGLIRTEAKIPEMELSVTSKKIWTWMCDFQSNQGDNYSANVGRILRNLDSASLWKLTFLKGKDDRQGQFVRVRSGRTVVLEAEERAPKATMADMFSEVKWFWRRILGYLSAKDATKSSGVCRSARKDGVKGCMEIKTGSVEGRWEGTTKPQLWQRLDLVIAECTHAVILRYTVEVGQGGVLIVKDGMDEKPKDVPPWGDSVIAYTPENVVEPGDTVTLSFQHKAGTTYSIWIYFTTPIFSVHSFRIREILYTQDTNNRTPLQILLSRSLSSPLLDAKVDHLLNSTFLPSDQPPCLVLHQALKARISPENLSRIISHSPLNLLATDKDLRTPLHTVFLLSSTPPDPVIISLLLKTSPGENAARIKDKTGRLPLHIAVERGASGPVLSVLVSCYEDGCYRVNPEGNLPVHSLHRSGNATTDGIELLLRPMLGSESICKQEGGEETKTLPLHIAAEYNVKWDIFESLVKTFPLGCSIPRGGKGGAYPMEIMEAHIHCSDKKDLEMKRDLLFVHFPLLANMEESSGIPYFFSRERVERISRRIQLELGLFGGKNPFCPFFIMSDITRLGWIFLSCVSPQMTAEALGGGSILMGAEEDMGVFNMVFPERDLYAQAVVSILDMAQSKHLGLVKYLGRVSTKGSAMSTSKDDEMMVFERVSPTIKKILFDKMRFCGIYETQQVVFSSADIFIMAAKDYSLQDNFKRLRKIAREREEKEDGGLTWYLFWGFVKKFLKINEKVCRRVLLMVEKSLTSGDFGSVIGIENYYQEEYVCEDDCSTADDSNDALQSILETAEGEDEEDATQLSLPSQEDYALYDMAPSNQPESSESIGSFLFEEFCRYFGVDSDGVRSVNLEFFRHEHHFLREKGTRKKLDAGFSTIEYLPILPILEDYDADKPKKSSKNEMFLKHCKENPTTLKLKLKRFSYCMVTMQYEKNLQQICVSERSSFEISQIRETLLSIAMSLKKLHDEFIIHGNLRLENVVRFRGQFSLIKLYSRYVFKANRKADMLVGISHEFSSGWLPPEMISKMNIDKDGHLLDNYERYWKVVSDDAKDLKLLTPDDIQTISHVIKSLLEEKEEPEHYDNVNLDEDGSIISSLDSSEPVTRQSNLKATHSNTFSTMTMTPNNQWRDILSVALITISFDDLPHSLRSSDTLEKMAKVWNRLLNNASLWEKIRPRICKEDGCAYVVKTYQDVASSANQNQNELKGHDEVLYSALPYNLVKASEKIDIWAFGILTYCLCARALPFPVDCDENLTSPHCFAQLHNWDRKMAETVINENIDDPLAKDLLLHILLPENERYGTMDQVMRHPFFGPPSSLEAQWILERHEEEQLMLEETTIVPKCTNETQNRLDNSTEKQCKIVFEEEKIVVPTCLIILPYRLVMSKEKLSKRPTVTGQDIKLAVEIGEHLLNINKSTARLSFWLLMKKNMAGNDGQKFKTHLKEWLRRARTEPAQRVSKEIVTAIKIGDEYIPLCMELLQQHDNVSKAKAYIKDPMGTARAAIRQSTDFLVRCFASQTQYLYLVDEYSGIPVLVKQGERLGGEDDDCSYPIDIDPNTRHLQNIFLPFINITVMTVTAIDGLQSLAKLFGLPSSFGIPDSWKKNTVPGLVHRSVQPSSVAEFAVLQDILRKQDQKTAATGGAPVKIGTLETPQYENVSMRSIWSETSQEDEGNEMRQLEVFFREYDPMRWFGRLRRVSNGNRDGCAIWTTGDTLARIRGELELATAETRLRELEKEKARRIQGLLEMESLQKRVRMLKRLGPQEHPLDNNCQNGQEHDPDISLTLGPKNIMGYANPNSVFNGSKKESATSVQERRRLKRGASERKKKKFGIRPFFGVC